MKLRNKRTGEIIYDAYIRETHDYQYDDPSHVLAVFQSQPGRSPERVSGGYTSLAELNEEWEDAQEEPKIDALSMMIVTLTYFIEDELDKDEPDKDEVDLEDCKSMLEKLKAWKRLKDKGFRFTGISVTALNMDCAVFEIGEDFYKEQSIRSSELNKDLRFLFGGKE